MVEINEFKNHEQTPDASLAINDNEFNEFSKWKINVTLQYTRDNLDSFLEINKIVCEDELTLKENQSYKIPPNLQINLQKENNIHSLKVSKKNEKGLFNNLYPNDKLVYLMYYTKKPDAIKGILAWKNDDNQTCQHVKFDYSLPPKLKKIQTFRGETTFSGALNQGGSSLRPVFTDLLTKGVETMHSIGKWWGEN